MVRAQRIMRSVEAKCERISREEIKLLLGQEVTNTKEGMRYLESTLLMVPGVPYASMELVSALLQVSMLPQIDNSTANTNVVRAVDFILADMDVSVKVKELVRLVTEKVGERADATQANISQVVEVAKDTITEAMVSLKSKVGNAIEEMGVEIKRQPRG